MSVISWGKCTIKNHVYDPTENSPTWVSMDTPKEGTTQLTATEGETKEAKIEGGEVIDYDFKANEYEFVFAIFCKKPASGSTFSYPITATNGLVTNEYAFQVIPADTACVGITIPRARVKVMESYSSEEGVLLEYHVRPILATGETKLVKVDVIS